MRLYISSLFEGSFGLTEEQKDYFMSNNHILASFAYYKPTHDEYYEKPKSIMLDSGAFTIMSSGLKKNNIDKFDPMEYCRNYANFINKKKIDFFIELDIESVFGFDVYRDCLHQLQDMTGRDPIYVYHRWRGLDYYKELVRKYDYVAIGDVDNITGSKGQEQYFPYLVEEAHKHNCKVHGLAFTQINELNYIPFDSVDSCTWTAAMRFAEIPRFNGHYIDKYRFTRSETMQMKSSTVAKIYSLTEWTKLAEYFATEYEPIW